CGRAALSAPDDGRRGHREERAAGGPASLPRAMPRGMKDRAVPFWVVEAIVLAALGALALALYVGFSDRFLLDWDVATLGMSIERFTVFEHQPPPPGYLGYVMLLKLVHAVTRLGPLDVTRVLSRLFSLATIALTWLAARRMAPGERGAALWAAALA